MSRRTAADVLVAGGGIVGTALALALARDGFETVLVEPSPPKPWRAEDPPDLRVVALAPDAKDLFDGLGVWRELAGARVSPFRRMCVWDSIAPGQLAFDAADAGRAALGWIVENALIRDVLWQACRTPAGAGPRLVGPATVDAVEQDDESIIAILGDGTRLRSRVLVACDGAQSPLRAQLGIGVAHRDYAQRAVVAHVATGRPHDATAWQRFLPGAVLAFLPLADGRSSIVWSLPDAEAARVLALDDAAFMRELGTAFDFRLGPVTATTKRAAFPLRMRLAGRYVAGRVVLAGDAAHVVHPLAGQGLNLGLRDVACLRRVLNDARTRGSAVGAHHVLRRYERKRRSANTLAAHGFDAIQRVFATDNIAVAALRGAGLSVAGRVPVLRDWFARAAGEGL